ncbi:NAD-dependent succinate-semialdehyde dehydrogenase [Flavobacterium antarcticum]|uniref:NAD-dependent succinate-semialdehyde dehydrogenase n=1 Tax=Flavobacterium antarcticum TaxID=271155 RepID=UPI0003B3DB63|nr:NAD-dependent succinate-semialdehyde dehydrogenase [Flavobacterium antarcticum]
MSIQTTNPYTNKVVKTFDPLTEDQLEQKIANAHKSYASWKTTPIAERAKYLHKVSELMLERKHELAKIITLEMGKLIAQSVGEIEMCASVYNYYAAHSAEFLKDKEIKDDGGKAFIRYTPKGVVLGVEPWNYPFNQVGRFTAPNLMAGNTVVVKHASNVPQCAQMIEDLFHEAGLPKGVFTNLFLPSNRIAQLAADDRIVAMALTGSEKAGASLAENAGKNLKKSVLELGGSDPFIVLEDANMDLVMKEIMIGRFGNMGQACTSSKRIIIHDSLAEDFTERLKSELATLKVGDPMEASTSLGPMISQEAADNIAKQVADTVKAGAKIVAGGKKMDREGAFYEPTILTDVKSGMRAYHEELFGPVAVIYKVKNQEEAIELANDSTFGLGGSVFSEDIDRAIEVASLIDTGMVFINEHSASKPDLPFGGTKRSGYGTELSPSAVTEFVNEKLIRIKTR